jgi:hypothetical protein
MVAFILLRRLCNISIRLFLWLCLVHSTFLLVGGTITGNETAQSEQPAVELDASIGRMKEIQSADSTKAR